MPKLMYLFLISFLTSTVAFLFPSISAKKMKGLAILMSLFPLLFLVSFDVHQWIGDHVEYDWFPSLSIQFNLRIDSLSLLFLYLTAIIIPISLLAVESENLSFPHVFYGFVLLLEGLLVGFFTARDLVLFVIFWEAMLFPLYFLITIWGKADRRRAALQFLIYMVTGSSLMIAAVLALYFASLSIEGLGTFDLDRLALIVSQSQSIAWVFPIFVLAFAVKTPLFPFHAWLPDAYYQASTSGTILLSALLSKAGIYGFLRIGLGVFPDMMKEWSPVLLGLAIAGTLYGGMAAWMQSDYKRLLAYSSFSHVNFILAGIFVWSQISHEGAILQALNHGITIAGLFLVAGWLEDRLDSTQLGPFGGLAKSFPLLCWLTMIFVLSSVALPGTNNFIGELLILFGLFGKNPWLAFLLGLTVVLSVIYMLRWMQHVYFEAPKKEFQHRRDDIKLKQLLIALPLVVLIFWIGIYPRPLLEEVISAAKKDILIDNKMERS